MALSRLLVDEGITATTTRAAAMASGKKGNPATHLENVKIIAPLLPSASGQHAIRQAIGLEGTAVQIWETYTESHTHDDGGVEVTQLPDIRKGDRLVTGGTTYLVQWAETQPAGVVMPATLMIYMIEDKSG